MTNSKKSKRLGTYITGDKGLNRVRMYPHERDGMLFLDYRDEAGKRKRLSLGHTDFTRGKIAANELAADLLKHEGPRGDELTLKALFDSYDVVVARGDIEKKSQKQKHDARARILFEQCWGSGTKVRDLDITHWNSFIAQRRNGALSPPDSRQKGVKNRQIEYDLRFLLAVMHWAEAVIVRGRPLLDRNPFRGFEVPKERKPNRPTVSSDECSALEKAAHQIGGRIELFFDLAYEIGHRGNANRQLRWSDVDFDAGLITWRAESDKEDGEHTTPVSETLLEKLRAARKKAARIGDGFVFPGEPESEAVSRESVIKWWRRLERLAGVRRIHRRGWHSLRRKFANDGNDAGVSLATLARLGGWNGIKTLTTVYLHPDERALRGAAERLAALRASGE